MAIPNAISPVCVGSTPKKSDPRKGTNLLIAADSPMDCQLLRNTLERSRFPLRIVGCALTKSEILRLTEVHSPHVALINEGLQDGPSAGLEVVRDLRFRLSTKVILLMRTARENLVVSAFRSGASGVFGRDESTEALCKCIMAVHAGQIWANSSQLRSVVDAFADTLPRVLPNPMGLGTFTPREREVARLVMEGHTNRSVAERLGLAEHTISNYLFRMYEKLGVSNRVELVLYLLNGSQATNGKTLSRAEPQRAVRKSVAGGE